MHIRLISQTRIHNTVTLCFYPHTNRSAVRRAFQFYTLLGVITQLTDN